MEITNSLLKHSAHQIPVITICTDASFSPHYKVGAWGCYIRVGDKVAKTGAVIKKEVLNSTEAERIGVANALWIASKMIDLKKCRIVLYCDNESAMKPVRPSTKTGAKKQRAKEQLDFYEKNIHKYLQQSLTYDVRHVKGHMDRSSRHKMKARHHIQDWCDKKAKELLQNHLSMKKYGI
jgi:ribonuclease HI